MLSRSILCLTLLIAALCLDAATVSIDPNPKVTPLQQNFTIYVHLDTITQIRGCTVWIDYDPTYLTYVTAARGVLLNGFSNYWWRNVQESPTRIRVACIILGADLSVTGPGNMLNLTFNGILGDFSTLTIYNIELYDVIGNVIPGTATNNGDVIIGSGASYGKVKCWLQGPYSSGVMLTGQNTLIPLTSPYSADPVTVAAIPADVVDWVLLELRSTANGQPVGYKSLFLGSDGFLRTPGAPYVLRMNAQTGPYYVVVRHRNHLAVMSSAAFLFASTGSPPLLDLTTAANVYGTNGVAVVAPGVVAMIAGDATQNGNVGPTDQNDYWRVQTGLSGYLSADFSLDGFVGPSDLNRFWRVNTGLMSQVPASQ